MLVRLVLRRGARHRSARARSPAQSRPTPRPSRAHRMLASVDTIDASRPALSAWSVRRAAAASPRSPACRRSRTRSTWARERRRVQDDRRRRDLAADHRRHRCRSASIGAIAVADSDPEHHLRRHRLGRRAQQRLDRPRRVQVDRRAARRGRSSGSTTPGRSARVRIHPTESRTSSGSRRSATSSSRTPSAASSRPPTAARPGRRCCSLRQHRRDGRRAAARQSERRLRVDVAARAQAVDDHQRRARGRLLQEHRRRRDAGRRSPAGCRTS